jgi:hypothetical protein
MMSLVGMSTPKLGSEINYASPSSSDVAVAFTYSLYFVYYD